MYISSLCIWILLAIKNNSISTKQRKNYSLLISSAITKQPRDNRVQPIVVINVVIVLYTSWFQLKYINPLLSRNMVIVWPSPECGVLGTWIVDLILKNPNFRLLYYVLAIDWNTAHYFIIHQVKLLFFILIGIFLRYKTIFWTYPHCTIQSSNHFILTYKSFKYFKSLLLSQINQPSQNNIQTILFSFQQ